MLLAWKIILENCNKDIDLKIHSYVLGKHDVTDDYVFHGHVFHEDSVRPHEQLNFPTRLSYV